MDCDEQQNGFLLIIYLSYCVNCKLISCFVALEFAKGISIV